MIILAYVLLSVYALFYFCKYVPKSNSFSTVRKDYLVFYIQYVVLSSFIWTILSITNYLAFKYYEDECKSNPKECKISPGLTTAANAAKLLEPLLLFFIRIQDPLVKRKITIFIRKKSLEKQRETLNESHMAFLESNYGINFISKNIRISKVYTILASILYLDNKYY